MKKIVLPLMLLVFALYSFSQAPALTKEDYLRKSKNQKTTGWILLGGGTAMVVAGIIVGTSSESSENGELFETSTGEDIGIALMVTGLAADLISIPFFIGSANNARKAAAISLQHQRIILPQQGGFAARILPSVTLKIRL